MKLSGSKQSIELIQRVDLARYLSETLLRQANAIDDAVRALEESADPAGRWEHALRVRASAARRHVTAMENTRARLVLLLMEIERFDPELNK